MRGKCRKSFSSFPVVEEKKIAKQLSQLNRTKYNKKQELRVLVDAIAKVKDTDEDDAQKKAEKR